MKTEVNQLSAEFSPRSLTLTFESQNELDAFGALFNWSPVVETLEVLMDRPEGSLKLYTPMIKLGADVSIDKISSCFSEKLRNT